MGEPPGPGVHGATLMSPGPKYLVMKRLNSPDSLQNVSPFLIRKVIDNACGGELELCKKLRNGTILIKTTNNTQAMKLLLLRSISPSIEIEITEHKSLNSSKAVLYSNDLRDIDEAEILSELRNQSVCEVRKIKKRVGDTLIETGLIILTFASPTYPTSIALGYEKVRLRPYIPMPLRCYNCLQFGHSAKICKNAKICPQCSNNWHLELNERCNLATSCVICKPLFSDNCNHAALDKKCPIFIKEKEIQAIITIEKVDKKKS